MTQLQSDKAFIKEVPNIHISFRVEDSLSRALLSLASPPNILDRDMKTDKADITDMRGFCPID